MNSHQISENYYKLINFIKLPWTYFTSFRI